jgi:hypothetical protein
MKQTPTECGAAILTLVYTIVTLVVFILFKVGVIR